MTADDVPASAASAPRRLREDNLVAVLHRVWDLTAAAEHDPAEVTGSDLMEATGLSRATVHAVCGELVDLGWFSELTERRGHAGYVKGRPARRYRFAAGAGVVVGVDAGHHRVAARVADLLGRELATATRTVEHDPATTPVAERVGAVEAVVLDALAAAGTDAPVLGLATGVPAPVDAASRTALVDNPYWEFMNPDLAGELGRRRGWTAVTDNDAALAALAEDWRGHGRGVRHHVTLLAGERFGAGVVDDGRLLRGARGGAGEMRVLGLVQGVGSADGVGATVREAVPGADPREVFARAAAGDADAAAVVEAVGQRLTRVVAVLAGLFDPEVVVVAGGVAGAGAALVDVVTRELPAVLEPPRPRVAASELGRDGVVLGAVKRALDVVRAAPLTRAPALAR